MNLRNLFATALVCALMALSFGTQAEEPTTLSIAQLQQASVSSSVQAKEPAPLTVAQVQQLKKKIIKGPTRPGGKGSQSFQSNPGGFQEFDACCDSCGEGGCTGCNSGPAGLSCGSGLIAADCQVVNDKVTCVKKDD